MSGPHILADGQMTHLCFYRHERRIDLLSKILRYLVESRSRQDSILLQLVVLLHGEGIVAGFERTVDELRRCRGCALARQRLC
jgi:hypothetical protein